MKSRILVVGFALISAFVVAQSGNTKTEPAASNDSKQGQVKLKVTPEKVEAGSENVRRVKAEMYCEQITFKEGSGAVFA